MASDANSDEDVVGADEGIDPAALSPKTRSPGKIVGDVATAATAVNPDVLSPIEAPLSLAPPKSVNLAPPRPVQLAQAQQPQYPGAGKGLFGSNAINMPAYDPNANPLDVQEKILTAKRDAAQRAASGPLTQFFYRSQAEKSAQEAADYSGQIKQIQDAKQQQKDAQAKADAMGVPRANQTPTQTDQSTLQDTLKRFRAGGLDGVEARKALIAQGHADLVANYQDDFVNGSEAQAKQGNELKTKLDAATTDKEYADVRAKLMDPKHPLYHPEFKVPETRAEWNATSGQRQDAIDQGNQIISGYRQTQANDHAYVDHPNKERAEALVKNTLGPNGKPLQGGVAVYNAANKVDGTKDITGSNDMRKRGAPRGEEGSWTPWDPATNGEATTKQIEAVYPKTEREKTISFLRTYKMATTDPDTGKALDEEETKKLINTNPNVQQAVAEGFAAAMRGGAGGANGQLMKIELAKRGPVQEGLDKLIAGWAGGKGVVTGEASQYLSKLTQGQVRYVLDFLKDYNNKDVATRLKGVARDVGVNGGYMDEIGLEKEFMDNPELKAAHAEGRDSARLYWSKKRAIIDGDHRIYVDDGAAGASIPGASRNPIPLAQLPGLTPELQPEAKAERAAALGTPNPGSPAAKVGVPPAVPPGGGPSNAVPPMIANSSIGQTVWGTANQTAMNLTKSPVVANNASVIATSSAHSESALNPNTLHDNNIGYGLYGHNKERLAALQGFAGVPVTGKPDPDNPIPPNVQTSFYIREMSQHARNDPFIAQVMNDPNASAEDLTKVQIRMERPKGYTGPGSEEKADNWAGRLATTKALMQKGGGAVAGGAQPPAAPQAVAAQPATITTPMGNRMTPAEAAYYGGQSKMMQAIPQMAPEIGATVGAIGGTAVGGPVGGAIGAGAGGTLGGMVKNYATGAPENQTVGGYATEGAKGFVKSIPAMVPGGGVPSMAARAALGGATQGGIKAAEGGTAGEVYDEAVGGLIGGAGGEVFSRSLGMVGHGLWQSLSGSGKADLVKAARVLAEQEPKIADATGKMVENKAYTEAAEKAKAFHQDPDALAYNFEETTKAIEQGKIPKTMGEATTQRPAEVERVKAGKELQKVQDFVGTAAEGQGVKFKTPAGAIPDGPVSSVLTPANPGGKIAAKFLPEAQHAEALMKGPAANANGVWGNHVEARSYLLQEERDAIRAGDTVRADAMRDIADKVRGKQEDMVKTLLPKNQADALIQHLKTSDTRYRRAMMAGGEDIVSTIAKGGEKGREAQAAFKALAGDDPMAQRMMDVLVKAQKPVAEGGKAVGVGSAAYLLAHVPGIGPYLSAGALTLKGGQLLRDYMTKRGAGSEATFAKLVASTRSPAVQNALGAAGATLGAGAGGEVARQTNVPNVQQPAMRPVPAPVPAWQPNS